MFKTNNLSRLYQNLLNKVSNLKFRCYNTLSFISQNNTSGDYLLNFVADLNDVISTMEVVENTPGIEDYAINQHTDPLYNVVDEFIILKDKILVARNWITQNFPRDPSGIYILKDELSVSGSVSVRYFSSTDLQPLVQLVQEIIDRID